MKKSIDKGIIQVKLVNIRDFALDKHKTCDDSPYGGGAGMVLKPEPLALALDSVGAMNKRTLYPSPSGKIYNQALAAELSLEEELIFICGRYEGIDQRIIDEYVDDEISIGDYVISSGEISTLVIVDGIYRLIEGVITAESLEEESFLEYLCWSIPTIQDLKFLGIDLYRIYFCLVTIKRFRNGAWRRGWKKRKRSDQTCWPISTQRY